MFHAIILDANNNGTGCHAYAEEPASYPANEFPCTQAQAQNPSLWQVVSGALVESLSASHTVQIGTVTNSYLAATATAVSFTSAAGVAQTYQADDGSFKKLERMIVGFQKIQTTPPGFYWVALDNTQVPFTYADMLGLAEAMAAQGFAAFAKLQTLKANIKAATSVAAVQAVVW